MPNLTRLLVFAGVVSDVFAQAPPPLKLKPALATHPVEFSGVAAIRELGDGRVIVVDTVEKKVLIADFRSGKVLPVGRTGDGPGEYRTPRMLFALGKDSTLLTDATARRWLLLSNDRPVATVGPQSPVLAGEGRDAFVRGADSAGRVVLSFLPRTLGRPPDKGDSFYVVRLSRTTARGDTVARLRSGFGGPPGSSTKAMPDEAREAQPGPVRVSMRPPIIGDQALGFADGWIGVARVDPYRVDWIDSSGRVHRGNSLPVPITTLDEREKRFYLERLSERDGKPAGRTSDVQDWRPVIPPFWGYNSSLFAAPGGALVIERARTIALPHATYDVVERGGAYRGQLSLLPRERIVGFGARSVYVIVVSDDGTERLRRHSWP